MIRSDFQDTLTLHGLELTRAETTTLQINVGLVCDLACRHCHLEAGPCRSETISAETVDDVIACARRFSFATVDITGGAPELSPHLPRLITALAPLTPRLIVRSNLTALMQPWAAALPELYRDHRVIIAASLPAANASQTEAQRGSGVWGHCIDMLGKLNRIGYGVPGSGLELDLVANPGGAFLPANQAQAERKFRQDLGRRHAITFSNLFTFANSPLGRFHTWLERSGNLEGYQRKLTESFNPSAVSGLMCRSLLSVDWNGFLYDCDFNLAAGLHHGAQRMHISELSRLPEQGAPIAVGNHCYACTAGAGFT
ncbi:MAG: arsenosugar biosynthesis radical SAM protein ArsS [Desulfuromonadales bacterium]|nr:arsenosugar biosynthesis radical SAM protein ArsS [Desulfuromonadales bacterium]